MPGRASFSFFQDMVANQRQFPEQAPELLTGIPWVGAAKPIIPILMYEYFILILVIAGGSPAPPRPSCGAFQVGMGGYRP
jgi:hypothetical protein